MCTRKMDKMIQEFCTFENKDEKCGFYFIVFSRVLHFIKSVVVNNMLWMCIHFQQKI